MGRGRERQGDLDVLTESLAPLNPAERRGLWWAGGTTIVLTLIVLVGLRPGGASAKWAVMAPIFVPMFMLPGYSPAMAQAAYRIGDSAVNVVTPLMTYFPLILTFAQKYEPKAGIGTLVAMMLPYSLWFTIGWVLLRVAWITLGWPLGPGAPLFLAK